MVRQYLAMYSLQIGSGFAYKSNISLITSLYSIIFLISVYL